MQHGVAQMVVVVEVVVMVVVRVIVLVAGRTVSLDAIVFDGDIMAGSQGCLFGILVGALAVTSLRGRLVLFPRPGRRASPEAGTLVPSLATLLLLVLDSPVLEPYFDLRKEKEIRERWGDGAECVPNSIPGDEGQSRAVKRTTDNI